GLSLSEAHVQRLEESADYFGMSFEPLAYHAVMEAAAKAAASDAQRLRFLLESDGRHWAEAAPVSVTPDVWRYIVSD
ncbi:MAG TPA: hypothetical protein DCL48_12225, partial [Alphaproteobacteria bacterium]|nr:hypothetical protein [Alphaproteobacteria bacterium]